MGIEFRHVEKFEEWLQEKLKSGDYDLLAFLDDVITKHGEHGIYEGTEDYEIRPYETKSGRPELYRYEVETQLLDEETETYGTIFTF